MDSELINQYQAFNRRYLASDHEIISNCYIHPQSRPYIHIITMHKIMQLHAHLRVYRLQTTYIWSTGQLLSSRFVPVGMASELINQYQAVNRRYLASDQARNNVLK